MRPVPLSRLRLAPELLHITTLHAALDGLEAALRLVHPNASDSPRFSGPELHLAIQLLCGMRVLRRRLRRYESHVRRPLAPTDDADDDLF